MNKIKEFLNPSNTLPFVIPCGLNDYKAQIDDLIKAGVWKPTNTVFLYPPTRGKVLVSPLIDLRVERVEDLQYLAQRGSILLLSDQGGVLFNNKLRAPFYRNGWKQYAVIKPKPICRDFRDPIIWEVYSVSSEDIETTPPSSTQTSTPSSTSSSPSISPAPSPLPELTRSPSPPSMASSPNVSPISSSSSGSSSPTAWLRAQLPSSAFTPILTPTSTSSTPPSSYYLSDEEEEDDDSFYYYY